MAANPEALMRSRYAAFALGLGAYLVDTLAAGHPERQGAREAVIRELSAAHVRQRFMGLRIYESFGGDDDAGGEGATEPARGQVLFYARIFEKGRDRSFVELSDFVRESGAWRYEKGVLGPAKLFAAELDTLTRATFLARMDDAGARVSSISDESDQFV